MSASAAIGCHFLFEDSAGQIVHCAQPDRRARGGAPDRNCQEAARHDWNAGAEIHKGRRAGGVIADQVPVRVGAALESCASPCSVNSPVPPRSASTPGRKTSAPASPTPRPASASRSSPTSPSAEDLRPSLPSWNLLSTGGLNSSCCPGVSLPRRLTYRPARIDHGFGQALKAAFQALGFMAMLQ